MSEAFDPPRLHGPFQWAPPLGIERAHYIALGAVDPAAAARFAVEHMGFNLVHVDGAGRHYLAGHGYDAYSLVYVPGANGSVDHISYVVADVAVLARACTQLKGAGITVELQEHSELWRHGPSVRLSSPGGSRIELTTGVMVAHPMAHAVPSTRAVPGPISFDHCILREKDLRAGYDFANRALGLRESGRIQRPDRVPVLGFFRCHTLYHCFGIAHSPFDGLHHLQMSFRDSHHVMAAYEKMKAKGTVKLRWGPLRHGAGQNMAYYFEDAVGNIVEYSAEEEIILDEDTYSPLVWSTTDWRPTDEWNRTKAPWSGPHPH